MQERMICGTQLRAEGCLALTYAARGRDIPCLPCRNQARVSTLKNEATSLELERDDARTIARGNLDRNATLEAENEKLKKSRDAWRELAQHARCLFSQRLHLSEQVHALDTLERREASQ